MSIRDNIRAATVGAPKTFQRKLVELPGGDKIEVRQPSVSERAYILDEAGSLDADGKPKVDTAKLQISAVIACCYVPGADEKVFGEYDRESLEKMPAGGWFDEVMKAAMGLINVSPDDAKNG